MAGNSIRNPIGPHRSERRIVTIPRKEGGRVVVIAETTEDNDDAVRGRSVFKRGWRKNIERAREGRESEWEENAK